MPEDHRDNPGGIRVPPPLIYAVPLIVGLLASSAASARFLPDRAARLAGWPLLCAGAVLAVWFGRTMREADTPFRLDEPAAKLVTEGPFGFSRNPGYLSFAMLYAGVACLRNSLWAAIMLPGVLLMVQRRVIRREEEYLERAFGEEYRSYKGRVRRWL